MKYIFNLVRLAEHLSPFPPKPLTPNQISDFVQLLSSEYNNQMNHYNQARQNLQERFALDKYF